MSDTVIRTTETNHGPTFAEIVDWMDPDWRDHFTDTDQAADHYRQYAAREWVQAVEELSK